MNEVSGGEEREPASPTAEVEPPLLRRRLVRCRPVAAAVLAGVLGALVGVQLAASSRATVGPFDVTFSLRPAPRGDTVVRVAPLGTLVADTHDGPFRVDARVEQIRPAAAKEILRDPDVLEGLPGRLVDDSRRGLRAVALRAAAAAVLCAMLLAGGALRRGRGARGGGAPAVVLLGGAAAVGYATWRPGAFASPSYTGVLASAPDVVGSAQDISRRFDTYRSQLARLIGNLSRLYRALGDLPTEAPEGDTVRVLHISDVHLNPAAFDLAGQLVRQFRVAAVIDTGDVTDYGTGLELGLVDAIGRLGVPYVLVPGNHDPPSVLEAVRAQPNGMVLDGDAVVVSGIRIWGVADPTFTQDQTQRVDTEEKKRQAEAFAATVRRRLRADMPPPVDVLAVHDARVAARSGDLVPLILAGHTHHFRQRRVGEALVLEQGSTGGAGVRNLNDGRREPLTATVLYFDAATRKLRAYDQLTVAGLPSQTVRLERHVVDTTEATPDRTPGG